jgi:hypothetical protein
MCLLRLCIGIGEPIALHLRIRIAIGIPVPIPFGNDVSIPLGI